LKALAAALGHHGLGGEDLSFEGCELDVHVVKKEEGQLQARVDADLVYPRMAFCCCNSISDGPQGRTCSKRFAVSLVVFSATNAPLLSPGVVASFELQT